MDELVQFLRARLNEDEQTAKAIEGEEQQWSPGDKSLGSAVVGTEFGAAVVVGPFDYLDWSVREHIATHDPERVLRDIEADRALVTAYMEAQAAVDEAACPDMYDVGRAQGLEEAVRHRAARYADRADYREEWRP